MNESNNYENYKENESNTVENIKNLVNENNITNTAKKEKEKIGPNNFICLALLGQGSFGEVYLVNKKYTNEYYGMKVLDKKKLNSKTFLNMQ